LHRAKFNGREVQITLKWPKQPLLSFKL
jgi:hypothetical protein